MSEVIPQTRSLSEVEVDPSGIPTSAEKKPRLDVELKPSEEQPVASTSTAAKSSQPTVGKRSKKKGSKRKKQKRHLPEPYSHEDVLWRDVRNLLGASIADGIIQEGNEWESPFQYGEELEVEVSAISSTGDGLAIAPAPKPPWVVVVPFALPGEVARVKIHQSRRLHSVSSLLEVKTPNPTLRDDSRIKCRYFGVCGGCQYQQLSYDTQLDLKRNVIVKAYRNFSGLPESTLPSIGTTIPSPLQYGYRTKITPHFKEPHKGAKKPEGNSKPDWLNIGFNINDTSRVLDIEECPIATPVLNEAYGPIREKIISNIMTYKRGATLLLRESLAIPGNSTDVGADPEATICVTDHKGTVREKVGDKIFEYPANSFFQNNNSVLVPLTSYVRDAIFAAGGTSDTQRPTHLVDAYCGSGLFAISLSDDFEKVVGIELSADSIRSATKNAALNGCQDKCSFLSGDAANIFSVVKDPEDFPRDKTVLIIDPPRKGTDENFIRQMMEFGCEAVVYVSCNVHTQARDIGMILGKETKDGRKYVIESLRGFDLFPQTAHVESVAVLRLR